jgi:hypothetical protein
VRATATEGAIRLTGRPSGVTGIVPLDPSKERVVPITLTVADQPTIYRASVRAFGRDRGRIRLRLPDDTAPGTYGGEATIGGERRKVVVEVAPVLRLRVNPRESIVAGAPRTRVEFGLSISNNGNVPFVVPKADSFDLDDASGHSRALGRALRAPVPKGRERVDVFFDELQKDHAGEARVSVVSGAGRLDPGQSTDLTCVLDVPESAQAGRSYSGAWHLGNTGHVIVVDVTKSARTKNGKAKP